MRKAFRIAAGIFYSLCPLLLALIIGLLVYNELPNFWGISVFIVLVALAIGSGIAIFKKVKSKGFINYSTVVHASPDLDDLKPL
ncbi:hypothetical protein SAMN06265379_103185 [Saccharicrinis carchari]|uniref:Uncharacterized protein n=1 Tax=Saccharicrinis carchari TaxID=1168039 RepID=A0A521CIY8_SACCC|nr:hypothetical protein [Saccharicrinis carchari]SMO59352.1 hypothetical protein SAMN06265379_103185 [Saccharicrinis carchari]